MTETELERIVVRLTGDGSSFQKMLSQAIAQVTSVTKIVQDSATKIEAINHSLQSFAGAALGALGGFGVATTLQGAFEKFSAGEKSMLGLRTAIESTGRVAEPLINEYKKLADQVANTTMTTKGEVLAMARKAELYGATGDAAKEAIAGAISLAAATDQEAESLLHAVVMYQQGNKHMLEHHLHMRGIHDQAEKDIRVQQLLAAGHRKSQEETGLLSNQIVKLQRSLAELSKEVGALVAQYLKPVVEWLEKAVKWFKELDPSIRKATVLFIALAATLASSLPMMNLVMPLLTGITKAIGLFGAALAFLSGPLGWLTIALGTVVGIWVYKVGGFAKAWEAVKDTVMVVWDWIQARTQEFMVWAYPIWQAISSFGITAWNLITQGAFYLYDRVVELLSSLGTFAAETWKKITGNALVNWTTIRDGIRDAVLFGEFVLLNFGDVAKYVWLGVQLSAVGFYNDFTHFFTSTVPALVGWFQSNVYGYFVHFFENLRTLQVNLSANILKIVGVTVSAVVMMWVSSQIKAGETILGVFKWLWDNAGDIALTAIKETAMTQVKVWQGMGALLTGSIKIDDIINRKQLQSNVAELAKDAYLNIDEMVNQMQQRLKDGKIWTPLTEGMKFEFKGLPALVPREMGALEAQLKKEFDSLGDKLGIGWLEFREKRLKEFAAQGILPPAAEKTADKKAEGLGIGLGAAFNKGLQHEMHKVDAVLYYSAEAITRLADYVDKFNTVQAQKGTAAISPQAVPALAGGGGAGGGGISLVRDDAVIAVLTQIRDAMKMGPGGVPPNPLPIEPAKLGFA